MTLDVLGVLRYLLGGDGEDSESTGGVLLEDIVVILRYGLFVHNLQHDLRRSFTEAVIPYTHHTIRRYHTHSLHIRIKLKPSIHHSLIISLT